MKRRRAPLACVSCLVFGLFGCTEQRAASEVPAIYAGDIAPLLQQRCGSCHNAENQRGDYNVDSYLDVIGCARRATGSVIEPPGVDAPLARVLARPDHAELLSPAEAARVVSWIAGNAPLAGPAVHAPGLLNPHSPEWHGRLAAVDRFAPITDAHDPRACGRCHQGAPVTPDGVRFGAPGAAACTACHQAKEGVLACGTCHGDGVDRAYPPRDACFFPALGSKDAHSAHVRSERLRPAPLACASCHPSADATLSGTHADGRVDIVLDPALAGAEARYEPATGSCSVVCHARGGARPQPGWAEQGELDCNACHLSPPLNHYAGSCDRCHIESDRAGTALTATTLHMNGHVDVGTGDGLCGACHGDADDPWPVTPSHASHKATFITNAITCEDCHRVPESVAASGHLDKGETTGADVRFGARAAARGFHPTYANGSCSDVACHAAGLADGPRAMPTWDAPASGGCELCHGAPPATDHPEDRGCAKLICHAGEVSASSDRLEISPAGRALHVDGVVQAGSP